MLSKKELFDKAADYDFDAIKEYLESGGDIEVYDGAVTAFFLLCWRHTIAMCIPATPTKQSSSKSMMTTRNTIIT